MLDERSLISHLGTILWCLRRGGLGFTWNWRNWRFGPHYTWYDGPHYGFDIGPLTIAVEVP